MAKRIKRSPQAQFEHDLRVFVKAALRRVSRNWPPRNQAFVNARIERGLYRCAMCKRSFKREQLQLDHIIPVVDLSGTEYTIEQWIRGLLVPVEGWQTLCSEGDYSCHSIKSHLENKIRTKNAEKERKALTKAGKKGIIT